MRISDWSSDVCSSDLRRFDRIKSGPGGRLAAALEPDTLEKAAAHRAGIDRERIAAALGIGAGDFADQPAKRNDAARHRSGHPAGGFLALFRAILVDLLVDIRSEEHTSELQSLM